MVTTQTLMAVGTTLTEDGTVIQNISSNSESHLITIMLMLIFHLPLITQLWLHQLIQPLLQLLLMMVESRSQITVLSILSKVQIGLVTILFTLNKRSTGAGL